MILVVDIYFLYYSIKKKEDWNLCMGRLSLVLADAVPDGKNGDGGHQDPGECV
jgi:hypothetical protein